MKHFLFSAAMIVATAAPLGAADSRFARSDSEARYLHWIDLYDVDNRRITPESTRPYSPRNTCGRCHDHETISHGWHFNALDPDADHGRGGEPWIWTDPRTGTQLPLSCRDWSHTFDPRSVGITNFEMTRHFGGRLPGGSPGAPASAKSGGSGAAAPDRDPADEPTRRKAADEETPYDRWPLAGSLEIDCMVCHAVSGTFDFNLRREQIADENFAWAATAALRLGTVSGSVSRIKDGADPEDEATQDRMPRVAFDASRFAPDGKVLMDLVREPDNNACYQCHSQRVVDEDGIEQRWVHDLDVHLRAGMSCVDCHRNGIDHKIARGFEGQVEPPHPTMATLSCAGCHLGAAHGDSSLAAGELPIDDRAGRLGAPRPRHEGLPPLHFEKMSCTACHGGPIPRDEALRVMTSLAHSLGEDKHRTGTELPAIVGPVYDKAEDGRIYPHRVMWPALWGTVEEGTVRPIPPERVYDITRRSLRVRRDMVAELLEPRVPSGQLRELLGEARAKAGPEAWTEQEKSKVDDWQREAGRAEFEEKVAAALETIEQKLDAPQAVYISAGTVYARGTQPDTIEAIELKAQLATDMVRWPIAHNVRPAGWSLGVGGCVECHSTEGKIFTSTFTPVGPGPETAQPVSMAQIQDIPVDQQLAWNELFKGRKSFKYVVGGSVAILMMVLMIGVGAVAATLVGRHSAGAE